MITDAIEVEDAAGEDLTITLKGKPEYLMRALVNGLPLEDLKRLDAALRAELDKRQSAK